MRAEAKNRYFTMICEERRIQDSLGIPREIEPKSNFHSHDAEQRPYAIAGSFVASNYTF